MANNWYRVWDSVTVWALTAGAAILLVIIGADLPKTLAMVFVGALLISMFFQLLWSDKDGAIMRIGVTILGVAVIIGAILAISWIVGWWQA